MDLLDPGIELGSPALQADSLSTELSGKPQGHAYITIMGFPFPDGKELLTVQNWVRFLGQEDPVEKGMATHSSIIGWRIPWTEESGRLQPIGSQRVRHN